VGFAPTAVSPLSKVSTVAFSVARLLDGKIAVTLDTWKEYRSSNSCQMVREYCEEMCRDCAKYFAMDC
jgi:hypothetical protein